MSERARRGPAVVFAFGDIGVPIVAADGEIGNQVVQVGFVHHHDTGIFQRGFVDEIVMRIVPDLVDGDVELRWVERLRRAGDNLEIEQGLRASTSASE